MKDTLKKLLLIVPVLLTLVLVPALTVLSALPGSPLTPSPGYSVYENRSMAGIPALSAESFWDGSYFAGWESLLSDRFYGREQWLRAYTAWSLLRCRASVNDVVVTDRALLLQNAIPNFSTYKYDSVSASLAQSARGIYDQVTAYGGTMLYVIVPHQRSALRDLYPAWQENNAAHLERLESAVRQAMDDAGVPLLQLRPAWAAQGRLEELYSKVDHHYNLAGAYAAYRAVCDELQAQGWDFPVVTEDHITFSTLPNPFLGTFGRRLYGLSPVTEQLLVYESDMSVPYERWDEGARTDAPVQQLPATTWQNVYYGTFMGGDHGETIVDTHRPDLPNILIWGDSFTNAFEAVAYMSFGEMRSLDFRHYDKMPLSAYIDAYRPDIVLCIREDANILAAGSARANGDVH